MNIREELSILVKANASNIDDGFDYPTAVEANKLSVDPTNHDLAELGLKNKTERYTDLRMWISTLERCFVELENDFVNDSHNPEAAKNLASHVFELGEELNNAKREAEELRLEIRRNHPERLGYLEFKYTPHPFFPGRTLMQQGTMDDCRDITVQSAVNTRKQPHFCDWINNKAIEPCVVGAGPEYYGLNGSFKTDYQCNATMSNHISMERRTQIYQDQEGNSLPTHGVGYGIYAEAVLNAIWWDERKQRETYPNICSGDNVYTSVSTILRSLDEWVDRKTGIIKKPRNLAFDHCESILLYLKKKNVIKIEKIKNQWHVTTLISRLTYDLSKVTVDDFNLVSNRDIFLPVKYNRDKEWHSRIGILMNGQKPRYFYQEPNFESKWVRKTVVRQDNSKVLAEVMTQGGIPFRGSSQLSPDMGTDYDTSRKYSFSPSWGSFFKAIFEKAISDGKINTCVKVNINNKDEENQFPSGPCIVDKDEKGYEKVNYSSQGYKLYQLPMEDFLAEDTQMKEFLVVLKAGVTDTDLVAMGLKSKKKAKNLRVANDGTFRLTYSIVKRSKGIPAFLQTLAQSSLVIHSELLIPCVVLFTDINKKPFYERKIGTVQ